jgi:hypothetical protein
MHGKKTTKITLTFILCVMGGTVLEEALDLSSDRILNEMNGDKHVLSIAGTE